MIMTVKAVKLISGEELLGEVMEETTTEIALKNVLAILISRAQDGNLGVGFVPFAPYLGKDVIHDFNRSQLIFVKEVDEQMRNQYNSIFGGIVTPPKTLILG
jgi:hypothetical protein